VIDLRNIYTPQEMQAAGLAYHSIGRPGGVPGAPPPTQEPAQAPDQERARLRAVR
jgi:hypothetical protein